MFSPSYQAKGNTDMSDHLTVGGLKRLLEGYDDNIEVVIDDPLNVGTATPMLVESRLVETGRDDIPLLEIIAPGTLKLRKRSGELARGRERFQVVYDDDGPSLRDK
jgi:hypothetical protein